MDAIHRTKQVEEGRRNIILQNRCGNRLTALFHEDAVELELVYKPNAFRRKDFRARNFSTRDNLTTLFRSVRLPEVRADFAVEFVYDPFLTTVRTESPARAKNSISLLNVADENVFAVAAHCPLVLTFEPHEEFVAEDGLLFEEFADRGEDIVSFVAFEGFERNRYRVLDDGRHVLQIMRDEVVLIGGEENLAQVDRVLDKLWGLTPEQLSEHTERCIAPVLARAHISVRDTDLQRVLDLNRRVVWSGLDAGGACFGALNRIYHLIWFRDGAMTAAQMALAGNPEVVRTWAPFAVDNPSRWVEHDGRRVPEYLQMVGTPWTKSEDDGLYYAVLSLFALHRATGDDLALTPERMQMLTDAVDHHVATRWDADLGLFGSDTRGETTLAGSDFFGYDSVNGAIRIDPFTEKGGKELARSYSVYHNVNAYNVFRMMEVLLAEAPQADAGAAGRYGALADQLEEVLRTRFVDPADGCYFSDYVVYTDGSTEWLRFEDADYWEYTWAVSAGPFHPGLATALHSAQAVRRKWPEVRPYGYCPWNTLAGQLHDFGMPTAEFRAMLDDELREALMVTRRYPMPGALTEYHGNPEGWRALPFSAATLLNAVGSLMLRGLPAGVAVRASTLVDGVTDYVFRAARITVLAEGEGEGVAGATVNGVPLAGTLQLPEAMLRTGRNEVHVMRGAYDGGPRLHSSSARLFAVESGGGRTSYRMASPTRADLVFERLGDHKVEATDAAGQPIQLTRQGIEGTGLTVVVARAQGDFTVTVGL